MDQFISGKKIFLRALSTDDLDIWAGWFNDPAIVQSMNKGIYPNTIESQKEYYDYLVASKNDLQLAIADSDTKELIGIIGLHKIDMLHRRGDISIVIGNKNYWGKGIGSEAIYLMVDHAFNKMNLHKVTAGMWSSNISSKKSFEKVGFNVEGNLREMFYRDEKYHDEIRLGLLKSEWEKRDK